MKCESCRKAEVLDSYWDKVRLWVFKHLFRTDYEDLRMDSYTQGISEGYKIGFESGQEIVKKFTNPFEYVHREKTENSES